MDIERYRRAQSIFNQVVDLDPVSRTAAIDVACGTDAVLHALVCELVTLDDVDSPVDNVADAIAADIVRAAGSVESLQPGDEVDRYTVEALLGSGGTAKVWAVRHRTLGTRHALKVLSWSDDTLQARLLREARAQASLDHPNIVPVRDVLDIDGVPALLMPLIDGPPLDLFLAQVSLTPPEAVGVLRGIVDGVAHAHAAGLIHRDIKAANVLLDLRTGQLVPRVADFGLVKATDAQTLTQPGDIMCTLASAAPEQLHAPETVGAAADIWSLGVVAFHLSTGHPPFSGNTLADVVEAHTTGPDVSRVPDLLRPFVAAALVADPAARAPSAAALRALLPELADPPDLSRVLRAARQLQAGEAIEPAPEPPSPALPVPGSASAPTPRWILVAVAAAVTGVAGLAWVLAWGA